MTLSIIGAGFGPTSTLSLRLAAANRLTAGLRRPRRAHDPAAGVIRAVRDRDTGNTSARSTIFSVQRPRAA